MTDEAATLAEVRRLRAEDPTIGNVKIGRALGISRQQAERLLNKLKLADAQAKASLPAVIAPSGLPALSFYDTARQALAQAKTFDDVTDILDRASAVREYARRGKDRQLEIDAAEIRTNAHKRWGEMFISLKKEGRVAKAAKGNQYTGPVKTDERSNYTLEDLGATKEFSATAQKLASISERALAARFQTMRQDPNVRISYNVLKDHPSRSMNRVEGVESLDNFWTPPWATRALCEEVLPHLGHIWDGSFGSAWEPACGEGHMSKVLAEYFEDVQSTDIHDHGFGFPPLDFLADLSPDTHEIAVPRDWIITNPPFSGDRAERFCLRALERATAGVAMFVALQFLETVGRYNRLFKDHPPTLISFFAERVNCVKGRWDPDGSTDAAYVWLVWVKDRPPLPPFWIPPGQRERLSKPDDRARFAAWSIKESIDPNTGEISEAAE